MKIILLVGILLHFIYPDCSNFLQYQCMLNNDCEWIDTYNQGLCSDLLESDCSSGDFGYCFWGMTFRGTEECQGGNYSISTGFCTEHENIIKKFIDNTLDSSIENLLTIFGYEKLGDKNIFLMN